MELITNRYNRFEDNMDKREQMLNKNREERNSDKENAIHLSDPLYPLSVVFFLLRSVLIK